MSENPQKSAKASPTADNGTPITGREAGTLLLTAEGIGKRLTTSFVGRNLHLYESLDSTNDTAKRLALDGEPEGSLVVALEQRSGRGRQDRTWISASGQNLTFSLIMRPKIDPEFLGLISLYASVAVASAIRALTGIEAGCKWPNDVIVRSKKISGILCESSISARSVESVVVGIGLNVNQEIFSHDLAAKATSLLLETGRVTDLAEVLGAVLGALEDSYRPSDAGWPAEVVAGWTKLSVVLGRRVEVAGANPAIAGVARSVSPTGALRIETGERTVEVSAGDVHLA